MVKGLTFKKTTTKENKYASMNFIMLDKEYKEVQNLFKNAPVHFLLTAVLIKTFLR